MRGITACVDVGGTFVDLALFSGSQPLGFHKILNQSDSPTAAVIDGLNELLRSASVGPSRISEVIYSTTMAVNAVVERKGAVTAMLTTDGFRDVVEIRTEQPYDLYNPFASFPEPIVPRDLRIGIAERTAFDGSVRRAVDPTELTRIARILRRRGVEAVAICLLNSYANDTNECTLLHWVARELPGVPVTLSSRVLAQLGEYGRFSTTCVNAYILPRLRHHLNELDSRLRSLGFAGRLLAVSSAGGMMTADVAAEFPVKLLESGPAAGSVGIAKLMEASHSLQAPTVVTFDMGGTTAKSSVIADGTPRITTEYEVGRIERFKRGSGLLVSVPTVDIVEVGAGGGSIAHIDAGGLLQVGPKSSGSDPGPACYGRGGLEPTVTDADLILGLLNPDYFLGGEMRLYPGLARDAIERQISPAISISLENTALGIYRVVNANMARALGVHAAEAGLNLQRATMVAIGGAGPVHAWAVARELAIPRIVVPFRAGIFSAIGCRLVPAAFEEVMSYKTLLAEVDIRRLRAIFDGMEHRCIEHLEGAAHRSGIRFERAVDLQYVGQRSTLTVPISGAESITQADLDSCVANFESAYRSTFGRIISDVSIEAVSWRVRAIEERATMWPDTVVRTPQEQHSPTSREVLMPDFGRVEMTVHRLTAITSGQRLNGPAIVEDVETTVVIPPRASAQLVESVGLVIEMTEHA